MSMDDIIKQKIKEALKPHVLELKNESQKHAGHMGDDGSGESHYRLKVVSDSFENLTGIERQRLVYEILRDELKSSIHALSLKALTKKET